MSWFDLTDYRVESGSLEKEPESLPTVTQILQAGWSRVIKLPSNDNTGLRRNECSACGNYLGIRSVVKEGFFNDLSRL
jgi:hypothetical protein